MKAYTKNEFNKLYFILVQKGPIHTFRGFKSNFYITEKSCCVNGNSKTDADYFCRSFYGASYISTSYEQGRYSESGSMGSQMHKGLGAKDGRMCFDRGTDIDGTNCSQEKCRIWPIDADHSGLFNIVCTKGKYIYITSTTNLQSSINEFATSYFSSILYNL